MTTPANVHGTAIVIGTRGFLFIGPSGTGKSAVALHCIGEARARGLFAALVSDDQVFVSETNGRLIARAPESIAGLAEVRGAGIVAVKTIEAAVLIRAIRPMDAASALVTASTPDRAAFHRAPAAGRGNRHGSTVAPPATHTATALP